MHDLVVLLPLLFERFDLGIQLFSLSVEVSGLILFELGHIGAGFLSNLINLQLCLLEFLFEFFELRVALPNNFLLLL